ncbi:MAG TPA: sugar phosphate isomerase/epimerase [Verrucomicrobia bacterium]|nr:sugar phosphate isomerase/epimerase [Verrucomicrobiota bacterium]HOB31938.1 sugar phosphate isomerase/epimerase family protein [Verrucomicrobiota bacterium]HOP97703.1 sugar phosphate isomerase/epimerase family protein [Verrucomicrobiota bacterium]
MLREIRELGFDYAELSHGTRISLMPGILEAVDAGEIRISSLHNFCPLPIGVNHAAPNLFQFSSESPRERELALKHTLRTLDFASRVKASVVVLHSGSIEMRPYTDRLIELVARGERDTEKYQRLCSEFDEKREARKQRHLDRVIELLKKIVAEAESRGLRLGIENRQSLEELPFESDYRMLFREIPSPALRYWHDTGHAQIKENLGFIHHALHLETFSPQLAGFHLHDVQFPARDHQPPGTGSVDFAALKPMVRPEHIKVFELSPSLPPEAVKAGVAHVKQLWGDE